MSVSFRFVEHSARPGLKLVEVLLDGNVVGAIYPRDNGIMIASAHFSEIENPENFDGEVFVDDGKISLPPIPHIQVSFKPRRYYFVGRRIVYID